MAGARSGYTTIRAECCQARPLMGQGGAAQEARKEGRVQGQTRVWTGGIACPPCRRVMPQTPSLTDFRRIVVKVGSSLLVDHAAGGLKRAWLDALAADIAELHQGKRDVLVVSSGAIAHGITAGQVLVTLGDTEERRRYLNARSTIAKLLEWRSVPVINENDTVATSEIRYGDNDRLAARVATMVSAELLVLLSDVDGLYDRPPEAGSGARLVPVVTRITPEIEAMAGASGSELARGGMLTKIEAGKIATTAGTHMVIASGRVQHPLRAIGDGASCTWFLTPANPVTSRKRWIAGSLEPRGALVIDAGAVKALRGGKSLLPAGVIKVEGGFGRGDAVVVRGPDGHEVGRGLVAYDAEDAEKIKGRSSGDVLLILGYTGRTAMIHRDDLVLGGE